MVVTFAALAVVLASAGPVAISLGASRPEAAALSVAIKRVMRQASIPGALIGVWQRGAAPYVRAFGVSDRATGQPMRTNLHMRIGSETKTFVGTALLQLDSNPAFARAWFAAPRRKWLRRQLLAYSFSKPFHWPCTSGSTS